MGALIRAGQAILVGSLCSACGSSSSGTVQSVGTVIASFTASPSWITTGQSTTLGWSVSGATSISIDPLGTQTGTSVQVSPTADTTYTLTATNQYGSARAQVTLPVFLPPTVWFAPYPHTTATYGSVDYMSLFRADALWANAAARVRVFKIYSYVLDMYDDAQLSNMLAGLKRRHIALAMEWGPLEGVAGCGVGIEGFQGSAALHYAQRILDLGGTLEYVAFDEPFYFGAIYDGPNACRWTPLETAQNALQYVTQLRSIFPDVIVGDIEPVPGVGAGVAWLALYEQWIDAWQAVSGKPLAFFHFDTVWSSEWQPAATALGRALAQRKVPVGHIYNGLGASSDATWLAAAEQHTADMENHASLAPDQAIFQSWDSVPTHVLPETDPTALTYLIDWYFRDRTQLALSNVNLDPNSPTWTATLTSGSGPASGASVSISAVALSGDGQTRPYVVSGVVPPGTQYVVFGARIAMEQCETVALPADVSLTDFTLDTGASGQLHQEFSNGLNGWGVWGDAALAEVQGAQFHAQVLSGQTLGLNSVPLPFAAAGAAYVFTVNAAIPVDAHGNACVSPIFLDQNQLEVNRDNILIVPPATVLGSATTGSDGSFSVSPGAQAAPTEVWMDYAGTATEWPASAWLLVPSPTSSLLPLAIATTSLPVATTGSAYAQQLSATGGTPGYLWASAGVPPGLVLGQDGRLTGTPTSKGTFTILVSVVDRSAPVQIVDTSLPLVVD